MPIHGHQVGDLHPHRPQLAPPFAADPAILRPLTALPHRRRKARASYQLPRRREAIHVVHRRQERQGGNPSHPGHGLQPLRTRLVRLVAVTLSSNTTRRLIASLPRATKNRRGTAAGGQLHRVGAAAEDDAGAVLKVELLTVSGPTCVIVDVPLGRIAPKAAISLGRCRLANRLGSPNWTNRRPRQSGAGATLSSRTNCRRPRGRPCCARRRGRRSPATARRSPTIGSPPRPTR